MSKKNRRQAASKPARRQQAHPAVHTRPTQANATRTHAETAGTRPATRTYVENARPTHADAIRAHAGNLPSSLPPEALPILAARDGYTNPSAFLGAASPQMADGTFVRSNLTWNQELLTTVYRESWLAKKIIDMKAEDMTRAWYTLVSSVSPEEKEALSRLETRHDIRGEITNALKWARLYGGSLAVMVIRGDEDRLSEPLDLDTLPPGCFQGLLVIDRTQGISPSLELETDLDDPDFGLPLYYDVSADLGDTTQVRVHHSRVLRFIGRELPYMEMQRESFWGASELEHIWDELQKRSATSANIAQLVFQANVTTLKMSDFGETLAMGTAAQRRRILESIEAQNRMRTSFGLQILSAEDSMENHPYSFSGLSEVYEAFMMDISGAAEIPATRLFGRSPQGMNATGEADLKIYYEHIGQLQQTYLRPALNKLLPVMEISALGYYAPDSEIVFEPIATTAPEERVRILSQFASSITSLFQAGLISKESALQELQSMGRDLGAFASLEPAPDPAPKPAPAPAPELAQAPSSEPTKGPPQPQTPAPSVRKFQSVKTKVQT